jgi:hypothetical protein
MIPGKCPDCGSTALTWASAVCGPHDIADGRHCIAELSVLVFLGCDACSCTVYTEPLEDLLARLSKRS